MPIEEYPVHDAINPGISYGVAFEELGAIREYHLDAERWYLFGYPPGFMATIIAHRRLSNLVELHTEQARADKAKRDAKRK